MSEKLFKPNEIRVIKKVSAIIAIGGALVIGGLILTAPDQTPAPPIITDPSLVPSAAVDVRILAISQKLGINEDNLKAAHAQVAVPPNRVVKNELSVYDEPTNTIYIYSTLFTQPLDRQISTVGHEYLHWVWETKVSDKDKIQLCNQLTPYMDKPAVKQRMTPYAQYAVGSPELCNELHSILGTEMNDSELTPNLKNWYKQWLPKRDALPSYF